MHQVELSDRAEIQDFFEPRPDSQGMSHVGSRSSHSQLLESANALRARSPSMSPSLAAAEGITMPRRSGRKKHKDAEFTAAHAEGQDVLRAFVHGDASLRGS